MQWWCSATGVAWQWSWQAYPGVWAFVAMLGAGHVWLLRRRRAAGRGPEEVRWRSRCFTGGLVVLWIALDWPLGALGAGYLASAHMLQFLLIALVAPPLLLLGIPSERDARPRATHAGPTPASVSPLVGFVVFHVVVVVTHVPAVADAAMPSQFGSLAIDLAWLAGGIVFWWPVAGPPPAHGARLHEIVRVAYLGFGGLAMTPLFVYLTFSRFPRYAVYELAPRVHEISARTDQQLAGLLMKVGGMLVLFVAMGLLFLQWTRREDLGAGLRDEGRLGSGR